MLPRTTDRLPSRASLMFGALLVAVLLSADRPARAADEAKSDTLPEASLSMVPANAAFYTASLRNKEQVDLFLKSNAYKAIRALPIVKMALAKAKEKMEEKDGPLAMYNKLIEDKDNKDLVELLTDAVSDEVFCYGGAGWNDLFPLYTKSYDAAMGAFKEFGGNPDDTLKGLARAGLLELQKNRAKIKTPELIVGFKIKQSAKVSAQLERLMKIATKLAEKEPLLKDRIKRTKVAGGDFVALEVDGGMLPWDEIPVKEIEENAGQFDDLVKHIKGSKLTVSVGVKDGFLLLSLSSTVKDLAKFNAKGKSLRSLKEFKPLLAHEKKKIISIGYTSKAFISSLGGYIDFNSRIKLVKSLVQSSELGEDRKKAIAKDLDALGEDLDSWKPVYGAGLAFAFLNDTGYEAYSYAYEHGTALKNVKCKLQNHFDGNPIFAVASGFNADGKGYNMVVKWIKTIYGHGEAIFMEMADDDAKDVYKKGAKEILPLFKRLDEATTKLLIPSIKESGLGLVIDAKWTSKKWHKEMPEMDKPMPMVEVGLLLGLSDSKKFLAAIKEYRTTLNELLEKGRASVPNPENIPEVKIPVPETEKVKDGELQFYPLPEEVGLDKQVQPVLGVGKSVAVIALSKKHAERLMARTPLKIKEGPLARKGNLVSVGMLNWPALVDAAAPWIEASMILVQSKGPPEDDKPKEKEKEKDKPKEKAADGTKEFVKQLHAGFKILKCIKGATWASYVEGDALVTHSQVVVKDLPGKEEK